MGVVADHADHLVVDGDDASTTPLGAVCAAVPVLLEVVVVVLPHAICEVVHPDLRSAPDGCHEFVLQACKVFWSLLKEFKQSTLNLSVN